MKYDKFYQDYIIDHINSDDYGVKAETPKEKVEFLKKTFMSEYGWAVSRMGEQKAMAEWLAGLPSAIDLPYQNDEIIDLAKKSGSLAENASEKQEEKVIDNYWNFMAFKIIQLFRKYKV